MDTPTYLFTFSPKGNTKDVNFTYIDHLVLYFKKWHYCMSQFEINPELNSSGNLHYHGYFVLKDRTKWHKSVLPKMKYNGLIKIDKVKNDLAKAMVYPRKDNQMMQDIITKYPVPYTNDNILLRRRLKLHDRDIEDYLNQLHINYDTTKASDLDYGLDPLIISSI